MTEYVEARALVGQGTIGGALVSQGVLDQGISGQFTPGGGDELNFGSVPVAPMIFMDDIIHGRERKIKATVRYCYGHENSSIIYP